MDVRCYRVEANTDDEEEDETRICLSGYSLDISSSRFEQFVEVLETRKVSLYQCRIGRTGPIIDDCISDLSRGSEKNVGNAMIKTSC